ncbi:MAG: DUF3168 domain-containing protein [Minwuia sp.]|nr:DUF3168 domain-containing protein [Minwuia sp.]
MTGDATSAVQAAVYTALTGASAVTDLVGNRIYDHVPQGSDTFPYIELGDPLTEPWDGSNMLGQVENLTIHVWSRQMGRKQTAAVLAAIHATLHRQALTITGQTHVLTVKRYQTIMADADGETWHGVARYEITTQATA